MTAVATRKTTRPSWHPGSLQVLLTSQPQTMPWLIALAQLLRVILRVRVMAGSYDIPLWISSSAFVVFGTLGLWLWRERQE